MSNKAKDSTVQFRKGDVLFREGTNGEYFFVIKSGQAEVTKTGKNGDQIPLAVLGSGQCVGEFAVLDGRPRSATVTALSDITAVKISAQAVEQQLKTLPSWFVTITRNLINRIRDVDNILKRNNIVDEQLADMIRAIEFNTSKPPAPDAPESKTNQPDEDVEIELE